MEYRVRSHQTMEFPYFTRSWDIEHYTSSTHHPNANGMAEQKRILRKSKVTKQDPHLAILNYRNTTSAEMDTTQRFIDRRTRTLLPTVSKRLEPTAKKS